MSVGMCSPPNSVIAQAVCLCFGGFVLEKEIIW